MKTARSYPKQQDEASPRLESLDKLKRLERVGLALQRWAERQGLDTEEMQKPQRELRDWIAQRESVT